MGRLYGGACGESDANGLDSDQLGLAYKLWFKIDLINSKCECREC